MTDGPVIYDVSLSLNMGASTIPPVNVRVLVELGSDVHVLAQAEAARDLAQEALRPFLNNKAHFGDWEPMVVEINR